MTEISASLCQHIDELRSRAIKSIIMIALCGGVLYNYGEVLLRVIARPVGRLVFIEPQEAFVTYIKVAFWGGLFAASPFVLYQIWQFIASGLKEKEKKYIGFFAPLSYTLFMVGAGFGFFVIIPFGMKVLLSFASDVMMPMITISRYVSFIATLTLAFGIVFQLPLVLLFLTKIGLVTPFSLRRARRYAIVLIFIAAALLTPPDVVSQLCMAGPLWVLYELGILLSQWNFKPKYRPID